MSGSSDAVDVEDAMCSRQNFAFPPKCFTPNSPKSKSKISTMAAVDENPKSATHPPNEDTIQDDTKSTMVESILDHDANALGDDGENVDVSSSTLTVAAASAAADANVDAEAGVAEVVHEDFSHGIGMYDNAINVPPNDDTNRVAILGEGVEGGELAAALSASPARHASWAADSETAAPPSSSSLRTSSLLRPLAADLSAYFATLSKTVLRRTTTNIVAGDSIHAAANVSATTSTAASSSIAMILWEGVGPILAAGQHDNINVMSCDSSSTFEGVISSIEGGQQHISTSRLITPQQAALYLYTVAQNVVALESAVLGTFSNGLASNAAAAAASDGGTMGWGNGTMGGTTMKTIMANQVAEIVSVSV
jgi:hypothetical protein